MEYNKCKNFVNRDRACASCKHVKCPRNTTNDNYIECGIRAQSIINILNEVETNITDIIFCNDARLLIQTIIGTMQIPKHVIERYTDEENN